MKLAFRVRSPLGTELWQATCHSLSVRRQAFMTIILLLHRAYCILGAQNSKVARSGPETARSLYVMEGLKVWNIRDHAWIVCFASLNFRKEIIFLSMCLKSLNYLASRMDKRAGQQTTFPVSSTQINKLQSLLLSLFGKAVAKSPCISILPCMFRFKKENRILILMSREFGMLYAFYSLALSRSPGLNCYDYSISALWHGTYVS